VRLGILSKLLLTITLLIAFSLALAGLFLGRREREVLVGQAVARLEAQAALLSGDLASGVPPDGLWPQHVAARTRARVTVIASDGKVLADSERLPESLESHADRSEVRMALKEGSGHAVRFSDTIHKELLYFAQVIPQLDRGRLVLRLAVPLSETVLASHRFFRDFLLISLASLVAAAGIALLWARRITQPVLRMVEFAGSVARGELTERLPIRPPDELGKLAEALNSMASDLRMTVQRLEEESRRVRTIMENMAEGLMVIDGRGRISLINPAAEMLLGLKKGSALGQTPLEAIRSYELDDLLKEARGRDGGTSAEITLTYPRRRILAGAAVTIRDADGGTQGTILALRDVTELKRLEEIRMEFVLNVSHELRTPLTAIRGYAETLLGGALEDREEARKFLGIIHRHTERLGRLLNDLLDLSNIELERVSLAIRPLALPDVARQAAAMLLPQAERKSIRLVTLFPENLPPVLADRDRLVQVLVNLIDNAVKYTPEGGAVTVRAGVLSQPAPEAERQPTVEIVVEDTGIGIPPRDLPRITERFYRVDKARSRELGGTGLGLAIVKHLVQAHQGTLTIESEVGKGTWVRIALPAAPAVIGSA